MEENLDNPQQDQQLMMTMMVTMKADRQNQERSQGCIEFGRIFQFYILKL